MSALIYKQEIPVGRFSLPGVAIHAAEQRGAPMVWYLDDGVLRGYQLVMTGEWTPQDMRHVCSFVSSDHSFVGHLFTTEAP